MFPKEKLDSFFFIAYTFFFHFLEDLVLSGRSDNSGISYQQLPEIRSVINMQAQANALWPLKAHIHPFTLLFMRCRLNKPLRN